MANAECVMKMAAKGSTRPAVELPTRRTRKGTAADGSVGPGPTVCDARSGPRSLPSRPKCACHHCWGAWSNLRASHSVLEARHMLET